MYSMSTRLSWQNPEVFDSYRSGRDMTGGVVAHQIGQVVLTELNPGMRVLEMGAGDGYLRECVRNNLLDSVVWVETDQSERYLGLSASRRETRVVSEFPVTPFADETFDAVIALSAFDTLPTDRLTASLEECTRILKLGGTVLHILDMAANTDDIYSEARSQGLLPFPAIMRRDDGEEVSGVHYVRKISLPEAISKMDQPDSIKAVLMRFVSNFEATQAYVGLNYPEIFDYVARILLREGLVEKSSTSWENFTDKLVASACKAGLAVVRNEVIEATANVRRRDIPKQVRNKAISVKRRFGVSSIDEVEPNDPRLGPRLKVKSNVLVHTLKKSTG
jgi:ubiquinone/menaquinone biosynthesis C-methylase UbiE